MGEALPKLTPNTKPHSLEKLRIEFDALIEKIHSLNYKVFLLTFNPIKPPYGIHESIINESATQTLQYLENKFLNKYLTKYDKKRTFLCFPKLSIIHSTKEGHTSNHIHMLAIMPECLIDELIKKFSEILKSKVGNAIPNLDIARYYDSSREFLNYSLRKSYNSEDKSVFDEVHMECLKFFYGSTRAKSQNNVKYTSSYFINQHLEIRKKLDITFPKPSLEEVRTQLHTQIQDIVQNPTHKMNVLISQVGTGKSYSVNELPKSVQNKKILLLVKRLENIAEYSNFTPLPSLPISVKKYLEEKSKDSVYTTKYLDQLNLENDIHNEIFLDYHNYLQEYKSTITNNQFIVTTHSKFFKSNLSKEKFDIVIFDECILDTYFNFQTLDINLEACLNQFKSQMSKVLNLQEGQTTAIKLSQSEKKKVHSILNMSIDYPTQFTKKYPNLKSKELKFMEMLLNSVHILKKGNNYCILKESYLPNDKTYLVLSATPLLKLYEKLFYNDLNILKLKAPKLLSMIRRISGKNISKNDLLIAENKQLASQYIEEYREKGYKVITYKDLNPDLHFYATTSQNNVTGENIFILGTPIPGSEYFRLLVSALGLGDGNDCSFDSIEKTRIKLSENNSSLSFIKSTYYYKISKSVEINELYYQLAKNELIQAIGRTRPYEYETEIMIFSIAEIPEFD